ncbi:MULTISPECIES: hypothetical protein [Marinilabiliaceae]|jgi:hypothetical protein|uniref:Uncharacterized protein n=3 Tax=Marinilabiliaceae TaxID=558415 RepID=A0A1I2FSR7_9BACT|nr:MULTISPECIES: hypothetical protein [Marinilabiliaceae]RCW39076.1 hypothetical protein DFO77_102231 [Marinilabilia salmonicolor]SFF08355.1 hypothetical protein SAMN05444380_1357 [Thermophagus xiamenensis]
MKVKQFILLLAIISSTDVFSQIKYKNTLSEIYETFQMEDGAIKYVRYNKPGKKILIYDLDQTLWREVSLPLPKGHTLEEIKHVSVDKFNNDTLVEVIYSCVHYSNLDSFEDPEKLSNSATYTLNIVNETGESLLKVPNSNSLKIFETQKDKNMLIFRHSQDGFIGKDETLIFSF